MISARRRKNTVRESKMEMERDTCKRFKHFKSKLEDNEESNLFKKLQLSSAMSCNFFFFSKDKFLRPILWKLEFFF